MTHDVRSAPRVSAASDLRVAAERARAAQQRWQQTPWRERRALFQTLRGAMASEAETLASFASPQHRDPAAALASEVLPLLDALAFLEKQGERVLRTQRPARAAAAGWLGKFRFKTHRRPWGLVLVVAPGNYPLFLPAVHGLQAVAAGNAVLLKPAPGHTAPLHWLAQQAERLGFPPHLITVLGEDVPEVRRAFEAGIDCAVVTGGYDAGRAVADLGAEYLVPIIAELSACDGTIVLPGSDLSSVVRHLTFACGLNSGRTCIAPRRLLVVEPLYDELLTALQAAWRQDRFALTARDTDVRNTASTLMEQGWQRVTDERFAPILLRSPSEAPPAPNVWPTDGPILLAEPVADDDQRIRQRVHATPGGLSAAVFGPKDRATALAESLAVGFATVNDIIVPTADPRVPFGGRGISGFGVTRGREGLLAMTRPAVVATRIGGRPRHLEPRRPGDERILAELARIRHSRSWSHRWKAIRQLIHHARQQRRDSSAGSGERP